jgi:hypothetical protein
MQVDPMAVASEAAHYLRRELVRAGLDGQLTPRLVNPRAQGWVNGFVLGLGDALELPSDKRYTLEATLYVTLFDGTPMGQQLGLEALMMARHPMTAALPGWDDNVARGRACGEAFARFQSLASGLGAALRD